MTSGSSTKTNTALKCCTCALPSSEVQYPEKETCLTTMQTVADHHSKPIFILTLQDFTQPHPTKLMCLLIIAVSPTPSAVSRVIAMPASHPIIYYYKCRWLVHNSWVLCTCIARWLADSARLSASLAAWLASLSFCWERVNHFLGCGSGARLVRLIMPKIINRRLKIWRRLDLSQSTGSDSATYRPRFATTPNSLVVNPSCCTGYPCRASSIISSCKALTST